MTTGITETELTGAWEGFVAEPARGGAAAGVLVLSGSSGRIERDRCRLFARAGVTAVSVRWFGGPGQPPGICEVPLETFAAATELLRERGAQRVSVLGTSKSAEGALLLAALSRCVDAVIALAPSAVVWANVGPGSDGQERPYRSCWSWQGRPLPFVPYESSWTQAEPAGELVSVLGWYEASLAEYPDLALAAAVPAERAEAELVLVAGGADRMWPSLPFAQQLAARCTAAGRSATLITDPDAGHRTVFPTEVPPPPSTVFDHGGTPGADARLGATAWPQVLAAVRGA
ncbi:acyl-CoA thioester hydrolase/BAAT C-terminal domain-containing protein [Kitasatospora sp. NPDC058965]|uniref:acyl-CoA thioester hydrolase/BAAT C-terminal domain-containing protein n=1 Tax=Kitasatospora sp. NPDC058965 TaxID=3346682 RepID=UPI0036B3383D